MVANRVFELVLQENRLLGLLIRGAQFKQGIRTDIKLPHLNYMLNFQNLILPHLAHVACRHGPKPSFYTSPRPRRKEG